MNIINIIVYAISGTLVNAFYVVSWYRMLDKTINWKDYQIYLAIFLLTLFGTIINFFIAQNFKILFLSIVYLIITGAIFQQIGKCVLAVITSEFVVMVSEAIFVIMCSLFYDNVSNLLNFPIGIFFINIIIALIAFLMLKFKIPNFIYNILYKALSNVKNNRLLLMFFLTIILASVLMITGWVEIPKNIMLLINTVLVVIYLIIISFLLYTQEKFKKVNNKYETSLSSLREYEEIMDRYRVDNHENKNQLLTIRNMVNKKETKTIKYIDNLVDNKIKDNETVFYKTSKIPEGGLRAIIYSKLCKMKDMKIKYTLNIANDVKTVDLIKIGDDTILNICKIIGVFSDNAIEAVTNLKTKKITIEIFVLDNKLCIDIANNFEGDIDADKLSNKGYTTKGKNHGYGLALVKKIIKEDNNLSHETEIKKNQFTQRLKIKM